MIDAVTDLEVARGECTEPFTPTELRMPMKLASTKGITCSVSQPAQAKPGEVFDLRYAQNPASETLVGASPRFLYVSPLIAD